MGDALGHDHGQNNVDGMPMRVDAQREHTGFDMSSEFARLWGGGFWWLHTSTHRHFSFFSRDRPEGGLLTSGTAKNEVVSC